jgi:hypothetical protein
VLGLDALGMDAERVGRLETLFRMELSRLAGHQVLSPRQIEESLRGSKLRSCSGDTECLAAIGRKLDVDIVLAGNVAALGESYVINIKAVDARTGAELRRIASDPLRGNPDELIEAVRIAAYRLLAPEHLVGSVMILADVAGATVLLDDRPVGKTPLPAPLGQLSLGEHRLSVRADGFSTFSDTVSVRFQKTTRVLVRLGAGADAGPLRAPAPAPVRDHRRWYNSAWFYAGVGVTAAVVGAFVGYRLSRTEVVDCRRDEELCM